MEPSSLEERLLRVERRLTQLEQSVEKRAFAGAASSASSRTLPTAGYKPLPPSPPIDWEALASTWFNRVGVVAIVLGVSFFLKYAFDHRWLGELGRVTIGVLAGVAMIYAGDEFCRKKMKHYGEMLIGGGLSVLYLSIYTAFSYYHL